MIMSLNDPYYEGKIRSATEHFDFTSVALRKAADVHWNDGQQIYRGCRFWASLNHAQGRFQTSPKSTQG